MARRKFYKSELTVSCESNSKARNIIGVLVSIVVLILISSMIVAAIVIINPDIVNLPLKSAAPREAVTLEEAMLGELSPNSFPTHWLKSSSQQQVSATNGEPDELLFEDLKSLNVIRLFPNYTEPQQLDATIQQPAPFQPKATTLISNTSLLSSVDYQGFKLSPSRRYLLIWTAKKKQFRHSFTAKYFLYDIELDLISMLSTKSAAANQTPVGDGLRGTLTGSTYENLDSASLYLNERDEGNEFTRFQLVDWFSSPLRPDSLILVQNNDIYVMPSVAASETQQANSLPIRLTFTGKLEEIFNGIPDWLYEEEILSEAKAFEVSPTGTALAFMSFNDSLVQQMTFPLYGPPEQVIPRVQRIRYPKSGRVNPTVSVQVIESLTGENRQTLKLELPDDLSQRQHYINRIKWLTDGRLALIWLNRNQNESFIIVCDRQNRWRCEKNVQLSSPGGWLDLTDDLLPLDDNHYLALLYRDMGSKWGSFKHVARLSHSQHMGGLQFLTGGLKEVTAINGVDQKNSLLYYTSTLEREPGQRHLFVGPLEASNADGADNDLCVTCLNHEDECKYNYAKLSPSASYYVLECAGPGVPRTELRALRTKEILQQLRPPSDSLTPSTAGQDDSRKRPHLVADPSDLLWTIEDNQALREKLASVKAMPLTMRLKVPIANSSYLADVLLLLPPQLGPATRYKLSPAVGRVRPRRSASPSASRSAARNGLEQPMFAHLTPETIGDFTEQLSSGQQYPMVVDVYAGPGSQRVDYTFRLNLGHYLASSRQTVYAMIDGRGSGFQGTKRLYELYHKFGTVEIEDQIEVAAYLARNYSFIDAHKLAIWGWSYGGYAAAMALAQSQARQPPTKQASNLTEEVNLRPVSGLEKLQLDQVFECAASVAPVTSWIFYDTAYTERYMSSPYLNELYDANSPGDHNQQANSASKQVSSSWLSGDLQDKWLNANKTIFNPILEPLKAALSMERTQWDLNWRYRRGSLLDQIARIGKKKFLLIHGTADDNVHFQQSIMLMKKLISRNVMFETRLYPDQDHGIANKADRLHLATSLSHFFADCFHMDY